METVTRLRATTSGTDRYRNPIVTGASETAISGALFDPGGSATTVEQGRSPVVTRPTLYFPDTRPDIIATDQIRVRGRVWEVDGDPADWRGWVDDFGGLVVPLKAVNG
jgi:hypothetical protein